MTLKITNKQEFKQLLQKHIVKFYRTKSNKRAFNKLSKRINIFESYSVYFNTVIITTKKDIKVIFCKQEEAYI
jgi:hypothetical protein